MLQCVSACCSVLHLRIIVYFSVVQCVLQEPVYNASDEQYLASCGSTATHCRTLQHAATRCNTLQHTAAHCNLAYEYALLAHLNCSVMHVSCCSMLQCNACFVLQYVAVYCRFRVSECIRVYYAYNTHSPTICITLQHTATPCNTMQHSNVHMRTHSPKIFATLQHNATHCNTLQLNATHCVTL